ncbi:MAG: hypothetical protein QM742_18545 [Aquabacterium sp.]
MKKHLQAAAMACAACVAVTAHAQSTTSEAKSGVTPFLSAGLTFGGDQIGEDVQYEDGANRSLHAGGMMDLRAGVEYQLPQQPWSFQLSIGYHFDRASAENGSATFHRIPLELLAHYRLNESWRVGAGLRKSLNAQSDASGLGNQFVSDRKYKSSAGFVVEAEVLFGQNIGLKVRGVSEEFTPETGPNTKLDGTHMGIYASYYFK